MKFQVWMVQCVILVAAMLPMSFAAAQSSTKPNDHQRATSKTVLVLKNGQVLTGQLSRDTTHVFVQTRSGSRVVIPAEQVDFVCDSLEEAYWKRLAAIRATDAEGQVQLFFWCLNHQLINQARNQIDLLQEMNVTATRLEFLHRQLTVAENRSRNASPSTPLDRADSAFAGTGDRRVRNVPEPNGTTDERPTIRQVGYDAETGVSTEIERQRRLKAMEDTIDRLSRTTVGNFKRQIEPLLVRACYDCHSDPNGPMPLHRLGLNQVIPRRMSQLNLNAVLGQIDSETPQTSALWLAAIQPHADLPEPLITPGTVPYQNLMDWVLNASAELRSTGGDVDGSPWRLAAEKKRDGSQPSELQSVERDSDRDAPRSHVPLTIAPRGLYPGVDKNTTNDDSSAPLPGISSPAPSPNMPVPDIPQLSPVPSRTQATSDPFDPTEFNQRYARPGTNPRR